MISLLIRALLLALLLPVVSSGAERQTQAGEFSFLSSFLQMAAALLLVIGLILLAYYLSTRLMRKMPVLTPGNRQIRVVEVRPMGPRKALVLVEVGGEYLLLSSSGEQLSLIKKINMLEEIEIIGEPDDRPSFGRLLKRALIRS